MAKKRVLLIGVGGAGSVFVRKWDLLSDKPFELCIASRRLESCQTVVNECQSKIPFYSVDADNVTALIDLISVVKPDVIVNLALPYQDLTIMDACLACGVHYLDTANYEPKETAKFEYKWQWAYKERFKEAGLMAILGCGFDPGMTNIYCAHAAKHHFDELHTIDILDCNAGNHGLPFATNFNPEINIREITQPGKYYADGAWHTIDAMSVHHGFDYPEVGEKESYLLYHEELESLVKHFPTVKRARFWMTFSESYLTHLKVLENVGLTGIDPVSFNGQDIIPIQFLQRLLPDPKSLAARYTGLTCIGCLITGVKDGKAKSLFVYNTCDHKACYEEVGAQAISYTTGVPALQGAILMCTGEWSGTGVFNVEELDPDPFTKSIGSLGLPFKEKNYEVPTAFR